MTTKSISLPKIIKKETARFRVLPLWNWVVAAVETTDDFERYWGFAFDPSTETALKKAESEALERYIYSIWCRTGISPFSGENEIPPPVATGFGAHPNSTFAKERAYYEWVERVSLQLISEGKLKMSEVAVPKMGMLFYAGLRAIDCNLQVYASRSQPNFSFSAATLSKNGKDVGVIFGSASALSTDQAIIRSVVETLRKLAFIEHWKKKNSAESPFSNATHFWLSPSGVDSVKRFISKGLTCNSNVTAPIPKNPLPHYLKTVSVGAHSISCYYDPGFKLPAPYCFEIPLL